MRDMADRAGLTVKQLRVYAAWFAGNTQAQVATIFGMDQPQVSRIIHRAMARNPHLPKPKGHGIQQARAA